MESMGLSRVYGCWYVYGILRVPMPLIASYLPQVALAAAPRQAPAAVHEEDLHPYIRMVLLQPPPEHLLLVRYTTSHFSGPIEPDIGPAHRSYSAIFATPLAPSYLIYSISLLFESISSQDFQCWIYNNVTCRISKAHRRAPRRGMFCNTHRVGRYRQLSHQYSGPPVKVAGLRHSSM